MKKRLAIVLSLVLALSMLFLTACGDKPVEDVVISLTHLGYVKRLPIAEYKAQNRGGKGVTGHKPKEEDFVDNMFVTSPSIRTAFTDTFRQYPNTSRLCSSSK